MTVNFWKVCLQLYHLIFVVLEIEHFELCACWASILYPLPQSWDLFIPELTVGTSEKSVIVSYSWWLSLREPEIFFSKIKLKYGLYKYGNKNICLAFENLTNSDRISNKAYWPLLKVQFLREKKYVMRGRKPSSKIETTILRLHHIHCARGNP